MHVDHVSKVDLDRLYKIKGTVEARIIGDYLSLHCLNSVENLDLVISELIRSNVKIQSIDIQNVNLETVFLNLTGKSLRD